MGLASPFNGPTAVVLNHFLSRGFWALVQYSLLAHDLSRKPVPTFRDHALDAALEPAGKFPKALDQGLGAFGFGHPGLDILQPGQIGLAAVLGQCPLSILHFPK